MWLIQTLLAMALVALSEQQDASRRVVCYYTNWSVYRPGTAKFNPQNINPYLCTHLIYAFGGLDRENGLRPYDKYQDIEQGGYAKFTGLKTYNKELKTLLAIGGWNEGSARFSPLVADQERRREFVKNVVRFLRQNHFDGLDLDWEYPAYRDGGKSQDRENYAQLVQELREEFERESSKTGRPRLLLTMAVPAGIEYIDKGYDVPKLNRYLDFMNILSYDYHSAFEPSVNHHSPLFSLEEDNEYNFDSKLTIDATVKHYLMKGADAEKLVLGIPTYGRSYTLFNPDSTELGSPADGPGEQGEATREKGYLAYYEICNNINNGWTVMQPKETAMGPYAYKENQWVGYDDESIVRKKSQYVNEKNLGGIMFWSIDNDDFRGKCHSRPYPLIEAAKEALIGKGVSNKLPSGARGGKKAGKTTPRTTTTPAPRSNTTPEPPTTPDPGSDFVCKDEGFFPHPRDCKKYFWCLDSGPSDLGIVAHQFTCPSGLFFNKAADSCDFARNVICKKKSTTSPTTTTTTAAPTKASKSSYGKITLPPKTTTYTTTTTTTTTTTPEPPLEEEEDEDYKEEDPQTIKQLINLIKKLGGVAELEKQLEGNSGIDSTTPAISKSLYQRVLSSGSPRYQTIQRNGPSGPQNEGLPRERSSSSFRREKPQYVTIKRERPSTSTESAELVYAVVEEEVEETTTRKETPKYQTISRTRVQQTEGTPKYQSAERFRSKAKPEEREDEPDRPQYQLAERFRQRPEEESDRPSTPRYTSILRSRPSTTSDSTATTSRYVVLQRQKSTTNRQADDVGTTENELGDEEEVTDHIIETTTTRPRVKIQTRGRRPFRKTVIRSTTTTTEAPTTVRQRTTAQSLRQRLNRIKSERNFLKATPSPAVKEERAEIGGNGPTTLRPTRKEFRRLIKPLPIEDSQLDASHDESKSSPPNEVRISKKPYTELRTSGKPQNEASITSKPQKQFLEHVTESNSEEYADEEPLILPDLANVAVAAIQSLATSPPPTTTTEKFLQATQVQRGTRLPAVRRRPLQTSRPTSAPPARSSPRPFAKVNYDDYEDYYAEPVEVPLSGKVRIHNDGYIECLDIGNFPHPFSCRKFISCAKMENGHILGWEYTCPKGLSFDPIGGICNWNAGLGCKD